MNSLSFLAYSAVASPVFAPILASGIRSSLGVFTEPSTALSFASNYAAYAAYKKRSIIHAHAEMMEPGRSNLDRLLTHPVKSYLFSLPLLFVSTWIQVRNIDRIGTGTLDPTFDPTAENVRLDGLEELLLLNSLTASLPTFAQSFEIVRNSFNSLKNTYQNRNLSLYDKVKFSIVPLSVLALEVAERTQQIRRLSDLTVKALNADYSSQKRTVSQSSEIGSMRRPETSPNPDFDPNFNPLERIMKQQEEKELTEKLTKEIERAIYKAMGLNPPHLDEEKSSRLRVDDYQAEVLMGLMKQAPEKGIDNLAEVFKAYVGLFAKVNFGDEYEVNQTNLAIVAEKVSRGPLNLTSISV